MVKIAVIYLWTLLYDKYPSLVVYVDYGMEEMNHAGLEEMNHGRIIWLLMYACLCFLLTFICLFISLKLCIYWNTYRKLKRWGVRKLEFDQVVVGFFHPYCNAGGGGERVLWQSISALQKRYSFVKCVVYTGYEKNASAEQIFLKVQKTFCINLKEPVEFVYLRGRMWVEPRCWPRFTIIGQAIGSIILGLEALLKFSPNFFVDTAGHSFVVPVFRWIGGCKTASYVHFPTVSLDMIEKVRSCESSYNNSYIISQNKFLTSMKLNYYRLFAKLYGFAGRRNHVVMVNSTWTHDHIAKLWRARNIYIIFPPCNTTSFVELSLQRRGNRFGIVSIGQFRPEKDHKLQLRILATFLRKLSSQEAKCVELVLIGSCRNKEDKDRVIKLRQLAKSLHIKDNVRFVVGSSFQELKEEVSGATAALHTMWNEHFGIGLVECMAAGCIMIGHRSGGPMKDIVVQWKGRKTGFLAESQEHYAACLYKVFCMSEEERTHMASCAREAVQSKFSVQVFEASFIRATEHIFG